MTSAIRAAIIDGRRRFHDVPITASCAFGGYSRTVIGTTTKFSGMEVIREEERPVWSMAYSGGIEPGDEELTEKTYAFLRKALIARVEFARLQSVQEDRFVSGRWMYCYRQEASNSAAFTHGREYVVYRGRYPDFEGVMSVYDAFFIFTNLIDNSR